jgi:hypothetical protein
MSVPLRKDEPDENLSTADLAQTKRPIALGGTRPKPPVSETGSVERAETANTPEVHNLAETSPLFPNDELESLRNQWNAVQGAFVDEPRRAVEQADGLVASAMKRLAEVFANERSNLEQQWDRGDNVSTEDLRIALQRYRSFFHRLLSV